MASLIYLLRILLHWRVYLVVVSQTLSSYMTVEDNAALVSSEFTKDMEALSKLDCAMKCLRESRCCAASYFPDSRCRLDISLSCNYGTSSSNDVITCRKSNDVACQCMQPTTSTGASDGSSMVTGIATVETSPAFHGNSDQTTDWGISTADVSSAVETSPAFHGNSDQTTDGVISTADVSSVTPYPCIGCPVYGSSMYEFNNALPMAEAKAYCESIGGGLPEYDSQGEMDFLKGEYNSRGGKRYWMGGYNFYGDTTFEWFSRPNETMEFSDFHSTQPDALDTDKCIAASTFFSYQWGSWLCTRKELFCCEIHH